MDDVTPAKRREILRGLESVRDITAEIQQNLANNELLAERRRRLCVELIDSTVTCDEIARATGLARNTVYKIVKPRATGGRRAKTKDTT